MIRKDDPSERSVLVVEDNQEVRAGICAALPAAFAGMDCTGVATVAEARHLLFTRQAQGRGFDLALIDIGLSDGSGVDVIRLIADQMPDTFPIVITIFDNDRTLFDALAAGARGYILKSATMSGLINQLKRIDEGEPPLSPQMAHRMMAHFRRFPQPSLQEAVGNAEALTQREQEVLTLLGKGLTAQDIAVALSITRNTCTTHIKAIYRKLSISSRAEAALEADRRGLL
ncbi:response regulator transcription factor [Rhizobium sp. TRM95796]|uniref:response regulator transcription factor n=1 Tax=Rhizobium sp. TRM95796 TaxID=2979862 RepID=UPI0021E8440C|nr:response regulator transcription factor [Rhizobium sp. TRM95796]MCV3764698.1 response regulator transcription factor [Rhizobium sp. TRM95796]